MHGTAQCLGESWPEISTAAVGVSAGSCLVLLWGWLKSFSEAVSLLDASGSIDAAGQLAGCFRKVDQGKPWWHCFKNLGGW